MAPSRRDWVVLLILPIITGIIGAFVGAYASVIAPKFFGPKREITIRVTPLTAARNDSVSGQYRITVGNSGDLAIKQLPVRVVAINPRPNATLHVLQFSTQPPFEFGKVSQDSNSVSHRFVVELLNPGDILNIVAAVGNASDLRVYAKAEDTRIRTIEAEKPLPEPRSVNARRGLSAIFGSFVSVAVAILGWLFKASVLFAGADHPPQQSGKRPFDDTPIGRNRRRRR